MSEGEPTFFCTMTWEAVDVVPAVVVAAAAAADDAVDIGAAESGAAS